MQIDSDLQDLLETANAVSRVCHKGEISIQLEIRISRTGGLSMVVGGEGQLESWLKHCIARMATDEAIIRAPRTSHEDRDIVFRQILFESGIENGELP